MLRAALHGKIAGCLGQQAEGASEAWRAIVDRSEDLLTSSVFERLSYLPEARAMALLLEAAGSPAEWPPEPVVHSHAWPHPDDDERTEPDWVFELTNYVVVVEAKWGRNVVPDEGQISRQASAAAVRWGHKPRLHLAVIQTGAVSFGEGVAGRVVRWSDLRRAVHAAMPGANPHEARILGDIREVLDRRGLASMYLHGLAAINVEISAWT